jgi:hypothetical protein
LLDAEFPCPIEVHRSGKKYIHRSKITTRASMPTKFWIFCRIENIAFDCFRLAECGHKMMIDK